MTPTLHQETDPIGLHLMIVQDQHPPDPRREWDHVGAMVCWHRRYHLGDDHDFATPKDFRKAMVGKTILELPLYLYDHSGLTISTRPFPCPWDSGQIGWIFVDRNDVLTGFDKKRLSQSLRSAAFDLLRSEVAVYDQWLRGDVWHAQIMEPDGTLIDACSGFYGQDLAIAEGRSMLAAAASERRRQQAEDFATAVTASRPDLAPTWEDRHDR